MNLKEMSILELMETHLLTEDEDFATEVKAELRSRFVDPKNEDPVEKIKVKSYKT